MHTVRQITIPHMGNLAIGVKAAVEDLGLNVILPPRPSKRTLDLGVFHSPEFVCFPLKVNVGNFIEAAELGADTILMAGGVGPCRFGYYAQLQREILFDAGYEVDMVLLEPPQGKVSELLRLIRDLSGGKPWSRIWRALRFGWEKFKALDDLDRAANKVRHLEAEGGTTQSRLEQAVSMVDAAGTMEAIKRALSDGIEAIGSVPRCPESKRKGLRVGIVGEVYMILEPFANQRLVQQLGELGAEVESAIYISDWMRSNLFLKTLRVSDRDHVEQAAKPYLNYFVGGDGLESVGETVNYSSRGFDGVIQVAPFTCMPELVAESILPLVSKDLSIPVLTLVLDEHSGEAGLRTRLEAFIDLLHHRKFHRGTSDSAKGQDKALNAIG